jgi:hypothetical protein
MKKFLTILAVLTASTLAAQTPGHYKVFRKHAGVGDSTRYVAPVNNSLWSLNANGMVTFLAQSNFITTANFNGLGDARWSLLGHTHLSADITNGSTGGNEAADDGKVAKYNTEGQLRGSVTNSSTPAVWGSSGGSGYGGLFTGSGGTTRLATPVAAIESNNSGLVMDAIRTSSGNAVHIGGLSGTGLDISDAGALSWTSATGAQTTATNLPVFGSASKGVVPASAGGTSNFLRADGTFAAPTTVSGNAGTATALATGRTISITGDLTYTSPTFNGSANVSAAGTLATVNSNVGSFGGPTEAIRVTVNAKGLVTSVSTSTITPAVGSITGLGTGVATALATPSSANVAAAVTDEMGTGSLAFGTAGVEAPYTGTDTYTAGVQPSGASTKTQFYTQVGNLVTWQIMITWANTSTTCTNVTLTFPTEFPTPAIPAGFTGASVRLYQCMPTRLLASPTGAMINGTTYMISRNAANNGFEIMSTTTFASGSYRTFIFGGTYFTQ